MASNFFCLPLFWASTSGFRTCKASENSVQPLDNFFFPSSNDEQTENSRPLRRFSPSTEGINQNYLIRKNKITDWQSRIHSCWEKQSRWRWRQVLDTSPALPDSILPPGLTACVVDIKSQSHFISCHRLEGSLGRSDSWITRLLCFISLEVLFGSYIVFTS